MQSLVIMLARAINARWSRTGKVFAVMTGVFATIALAALYDHMFLMLGFGALVSWAALAIDKHRVREAKQLATGRPDVRR